MIKAVEAYIEKYHMIEEQDTVVAGISGGADSVCLLLQLNAYRQKVPFDLKVVHVNHLIRSDAGEDAAYVENLCKQMGIPFFLFEEDVEVIAGRDGISTEEAGRIVRYRAFEEVLQNSSPSGKIAVAHNKNDCAETVLFHLFRGSRLAGLQGIRPTRDQIIRPLLCISRQEIEEYLTGHQMSWCIDSTNNENTYTRNKIRNQLLPFVDQEICHNAIEHIAATAEEAALLQDFLQKETRRALELCVQQTEEGREVDIEKLNTYHELLRKQIILSILEELTPARKDITSTHVEDILKLCNTTGYHKVMLPYQLEAVKQYHMLEIRIRRKQQENEYYEIEVPGRVLLKDGRKVYFSLISPQKDEIIPRKTYTKWFDYDKILHCLVLRNRQSGDYLTVNQVLSHKKVKEYMIEEKIEKEERDKQLLLADEHHILWVLGRRISEAYKVSNETKRILQVTVEQKDFEKIQDI